MARKALSDGNLHAYLQSNQNIWHLSCHSYSWLLSRTFGVDFLDTELMKHILNFTSDGVVEVILIDSVPLD